MQLPPATLTRLTSGVMSATGGMRATASLANSNEKSRMRAPTYLILLAALGGCAAGAPATRNSLSQTVTYTADDHNFPNPERGFSWPDGDARAIRRANMSLAHVYLRLDGFKAGPISAAFLKNVEQRFSDARSAGVKLVPRFAYNFPAGLPLKAGDEDAPLAIVLGHIKQLAPLLRRNSDVMAFIEAGFIGAWGEWHDSTNNLDSPAAKRAILERLLSAVPQDRFVALRYPRDKIAFFNRIAPATPEERFAGTDYGRVAHHDDCFLASADDWDTYRPKDPASIAKQKTWLSVENEHAPQGGETCNAAQDAQPFIHCATAVPEMERLHWSQMNAQYNTDVLGLWLKEGCYAEIAKRLGYRLRLVSALFPRSVRSGGQLKGSLVIANDGFAAPYNRRRAELVLRNRQTGSTMVLRLKLDPRQWTSESQHSVTIKVALPVALQSGYYDLLLNLADPARALRTRPEYAIRLANVGTWEVATGYNRLLIAVQVRR